MEITTRMKHMLKRTHTLTFSYSTPQTSKRTCHRSNGKHACILLSLSAFMCVCLCACASTVSIWMYEQESDFLRFACSIPHHPHAQRRHSPTYSDCVSHTIYSLYIQASTTTTATTTPPTPTLAAITTWAMLMRKKCMDSLSYRTKQCQCFHQKRSETKWNGMAWYGMEWNGKKQEGTKRNIAIYRWKGKEKAKGKKGIFRALLKKPESRYVFIYVYIHTLI